MAGLADAMGGMPGGMGGGMGPMGGGGDMAQVFQMATLILGRPPRDMQEAMNAVFSTHPTDGMGDTLEGLMGKPPGIMQGVPSMPANQMPPNIQQGIQQLGQRGGGGMPFPMAPQMPQPRRPMPSRRY